MNQSVSKLRAGSGSGEVAMIQSLGGAASTAVTHILGECRKIQNGLTRVEKLSVF